MGRPVNSLVGQRFGMLKVIERAENAENRQTRWLCQCDCGRTYIAYGLNLKTNRTISCGQCTKEEMDKEHMRQTPVNLDRLRKDNTDPYQNLANAIVAVAADDYRTALQDGNDKLKSSLERFFHSGWYKTLTKLNPDILLDALHKEHDGSLTAVYACP